MIRDRIKALFGVASIAWSCAAFAAPAPNDQPATTDVASATLPAQLDIEPAAPGSMVDVRDAVKLDLAKRLADQAARRATLSFDS